MDDMTRDFYSRLEKEQTKALWQIIPAEKPGERREPQPQAKPYLWKWERIYPLLEEAVSVVKVDRASERRVLCLANPGLTRGTTHTLNGCLQILCPGESAPTHRHSVAAIRFIIKGNGACTIVDGEKIPMKEGDLILTPAMMWHDHSNETTGPVVWFDGLDSPFVELLNLSFFDSYPEEKQPITKPDAYTTEKLTMAGLRPPGIRPEANFGLPFIYRWEDTSQALTRMAALEGEGDPHDGVILDYINPITGGPTLPSLGCQIQLLRPGEETKVHRHTSSAVYHVFRGSGYSMVNDERIEWTQGDTFALPPWAWHRFGNSTSKEAILFSINDKPILEPHGLYREETKE